MKPDNSTDERIQRDLPDQVEARTALWIDEETGQIMHQLPAKPPIRPTSGRACLRLQGIDLGAAVRRITTSLGPALKAIKAPRAVELLPDRRIVALDALPERFPRLLLGKRGEL